MTIHTMNDAERIAYLEAQVSRLQAAQQAQANVPLRCKVGAKGGVSVYGLNAKWPVTLYRKQWEKLIAFVPQVQAFIDANADALSSKIED